MIVDANVLLYAVDASSAFHQPARDWLEGALNGPSRVGFPWVSLTAFQRIATHPRVSANPLSPQQAWSHVSDWLDADQSWIPHPGDRHAVILSRLVIDGDLRGNLVTDAHLAALALEHGVGVCSTDSDFARFPELAWHNPARAS
ncbi:PIN domain-containing protein [Actinobacteria bacterium YIM 96077]|uniref:Ribonuclease VapC n=1 Tax=Phytoactinopolyspora halophila TaxID=1981511 RepID=A0A329QCI3_9ACTN|nr:TA system VapC family ribonuclease toxin [Phytoactinopolyspora halophila]AYY13947.1 PIN domain-containing protein [Actinobacteria bacterium YIM 96077]RAW10076.1 VapC toxin family PIN domain ribonuclease [Phytoactinopolyspora halophila]